MNKKEKYTKYFNKIRSINYAITIHQSVLIAHSIGLLDFIGNRSVTYKEIYSEFKSFEPSALNAIISACLYLELLEIDITDQIVVSDCTKSTLLKNSECNMRKILDFWYEEDISIKTLESRFMKREKNIVNFDNKSLEIVTSFIDKMHSKSFIPAKFLTEYLDLSNIDTFLDIGGGSGIFSIEVKKRWPHINCTIYEQDSVIDITKKYIQAEGLDSKIAIKAGDMFKDILPNADVHFYSEIFHDWSIDECKHLAQRSYNSLNNGGMIILFEMLFNADSSGPMNTVGQNITMQLYTNGQQFTLNQIREILTQAGFAQIKFIKTNTNYTIISGIK